MNIAIISDIHGNLESLAAISEPYDELWFWADSGSITDPIPAV